MLFLLAYLVELALLRGQILFGAAWFPTARVILDCSALAAAGWVAGRSNREHTLLTAAIFALTLSPRDFEPLLPLNLPWLARLALDSLRDSRYFESLLTTAAAQAILLGCVFMGASLARPKEAPPRIL